MKQARTERGTFAPKFTIKDLAEIASMLDEGKSIPAVKLAIMQARGVSEPTALRWIRQAQTGGELKHGK
jgi:hypothetical protein